MAVLKMTKEEFKTRYGYDPFQKTVTSSAATPKKEERGLIESVLKRPLERLVLEPGRRLGEAVGSAALKPFLTPEQEARRKAAVEEDTELDVPFLGKFQMRGLKPGTEGLKQIAGESFETGGYLLPGAGVKAPLSAKVLRGAGTGYSFDVGTDLQANRSIGEALTPGAATLVGGALPLVGHGLSKLPKTLERINERLTPTQARNLADKGKDVAGYLARKKIVGSPEVRYNKVQGLVDRMENKVDEVVRGSGKTYNKNAVVGELLKVPNQFQDDLAVYEPMVAATRKMVENLQRRPGETIPAITIQSFKRSLWKAARFKENGDAANLAHYELGSALKGLLDRTIPGLERLNKEYGLLLEAEKVLKKAIGRRESGLVARGLGAASGAIMGTAAGSTLGPAGAAAGGTAGLYFGERAASKLFGTATRSTIGAGVQTLLDAVNRLPIDSQGRIQLSQKALMTLIRELLPVEEIQSKSTPQPQENLNTSTPDQLPTQSNRAFSSPKSSMLDESQQAAIRRGVENAKMVSPNIGGLAVAGAKIAAPIVARFVAKLPHIHPDDIKVMLQYVEKQGGTNVLKDAQALAEKWGIDVNRSAGYVASQFKKILEGAKKVSGTNLQGRDTLGRFTEVK